MKYLVIYSSGYSFDTLTCETKEETIKFISTIRGKVEVFTLVNGLFEKMKITNKIELIN